MTEDVVLVRESSRFFRDAAEGERAQLSPALLTLRRAVEQAFDPTNLFNPGKKGTAP